MKLKTIDSFFKKKSTETTQPPSEASQIEVPHSSLAPLNSDAHPFKIPRVEDEELDLSNLEREPGLRKQIYEYLVNMQYSPFKDALFCLSCFLFNSNPSSRFGSIAFTHSCFSNWKKLHDGSNCAFLTHTEKDLNSLHNNAQRAYVDLMNQAQHIECAFRGHNESSGSKNRGNFLELLSLLSSYDEKNEYVLKSAPQNASYTSSTIQKEILQIYANRVCNVIREEIGDRKFSIIMDKARDESQKEQMAIIFRFVDKQGQVKEQFFDMVHVKNIASLTLKNVIFNVLLQHSYDGPSNMHGEFNDLQALILNDCRYAYYVHYFAHRLQLALVATAREVVEVHQFFKDLSDIVNIAPASSKRHDELQKAQAATGIRMNQIETLQRPGETRWSSHLNSVTSLLKMYNATSTLDFLDMNAQYIVGRSRNKKDDVIVEHHYRVDIFFATIDTQLQELKSRFNKNIVKLLTLITALDPNEFFKLFDIDKICILKERLPYKLKHYELDVCKHLDLRKISTLSELCRSSVESGKLVMYPLVDRLIRLILTLPVSTASSESAFSAIKIVKTRLRSKMEEFLRSSLVVYIEIEIAKKFDINKIIDDFSKVKD
ncbi:hypothetical protein ES332_D06G115000v1 [Gossypium tomentosum]|uniref:TTF-type domain-containing protein n=1 Tax=Gossypium tomentosum TaxID=34277 RepID=A0A5D2KGT2_GOSTO|nr:hypothetical protein ES332_D06G115000v1 [Gossypium tomentosum]